MINQQKRRRLLINLSIVIVLVVGTIIAVQFAKGYRPDLKNRQIQGTGLLSATSYPKVARVILNDKLTTVTDDKIYLQPGNYTIKIEKDGFHTWTKSFPIKSELVTSIDARLFPLIPATSPLTFYQVQNPSVNPDGTKIAYVLQNAPLDADNGLYVYSFSSNLLGSQNLQIATGRDYSKATLVWSPDSSEILALFTETSTPTKANPKPSERILSSQLLSTKSLNQAKNMTDVTLRLPLLVNEWQNRYATLNTATLNLYPTYLTEILSQKAVNVYFSPDKERVFYTSTADLSLPSNDIGASLPNLNSTPETRELQKGLTYVFDLKEGTNYLLSGTQTTNNNFNQTLITNKTATPSATINDLKLLKTQTESRYTTNLSWYGSRQLILTNPDGVNILDYDGLNLTNITAATIKNNFIISTPDGSKLLGLTNINQKTDTFNLISFDLK